MEYCQHDYAFGFDTVEDSVREAGNEGAADFAMDTRKHFWIALDRVEGRRPGEPLASPGFGEHLVSRNDVVGVTLVFGQTLVDHRAMGIAQRVGGRV